jgi:hypothetical protein
MVNIIKNTPNLCKIFIRKKITVLPNAFVINNRNELFKQLNNDLYNAVNKYDKTNYFYSQSYWDRFDKTLLFTDSYWTDYICCENWLKSKKRNDILKSYGEYFKVETTYNILLDKMAEDVFLL